MPNHLVDDYTIAIPEIDSTTCVDACALASCQNGNDPASAHDRSRAKRSEIAKGSTRNPSPLGEKQPERTLAHINIPGRIWSTVKRPDRRTLTAASRRLELDEPTIKSWLSDPLR